VVAAAITSVIGMAYFTLLGQPDKVARTGQEAEHPNTTGQK